MGRPPLGMAAKKVSVSVRITPAEEAALTRRFGSPRAAFQKFAAKVADEETKK